MKIGQIESKHQYGLKRKEIRYHYSEQGSLHSGKQNNFVQNRSILSKPLREGANAQVSFKGFEFAYAQKAFNPIIKKVPQNLTEKVFDSLKKISKQQYKYYTDIKNEYLEYIIKNEDFRKQNGISDTLLEEIKKGQLIYIPKKNLMSKFLNQLASPFISVYRWGEKVVLPKNSEILAKRTEKERILKNFRSLEGLLKSHEIWENGYRKMSGHSKFTENSRFIIPDDVLLGKINRRRNKVVDPNKGKYSSNSLMIGNRLISGIIYSYFLGTDAYNTTMRYSNDKTEAANQRKSRVAQEFSRIGLNMYIQNLLFGTFETAVNRSLPTAMFVSGSTVAFSEILGRKLVGKPIMPSDKETLDRLEKEMYEKKGILPSIGRLLTTVKKKEPTITKAISNTPSTSYTKTKANDSLFKAFAAKDSTQTATVPSFKGLAKVDKKQLDKFFKLEKLISKDKIKELYDVIKETDSQTAETLKNSIMKSIRKSEYFPQNNIKRPETFEELLESNTIKNVPIGHKDTWWGKLTSSIIVPLKFVSNVSKSIIKFVKKGINIINNKKNNTLLDDLNRLKSSKNPSEQKIYEKFKDFYNQRMQLEAWAKSPLSEEDKLLKIFAEFKSIKNKDKEDIEGAKNILLWLDKQIKREKIQIQPDGTLNKEDLQKVQNILKDSVLKADGEKQLEYDGNTLAQTNINLSRAITTLFLITDAYNLTMQYSNDNRKDANKSAKNRAAQEISRISVSAYIMAFVHNLLSKLCNSSLAGAFTLTALTSTINDSISREVVGVPLTAKTQEELEEIDKKNSKSKSPIKKALAYSIGKKSAIPQKQTQSKETTNNIDYLSNDFFITPQIN